MDSNQHTKELFVFYLQFCYSLRKEKETSSIISKYVPAAYCLENIHVFRNCDILITQNILTLPSLLNSIEFILTQKY